MFCNGSLPALVQVTELIGSGSYGSVCEAVDDHKDAVWNRQVVAIKKCKRIFEDLVDCKRILREAYSHGMPSWNMNVVQVLDFFIPGSDCSDPLDEFMTQGGPFPLTTSPHR
eukprot:Skav233566  [mRNA]  locus=scaffold563:703174:704010:- [translate_table: standard]